MNWIGIVLLVLIVGFIVSRMLPAKGVQSASPDEVKQLLSKGKATVQFIDVREAGEYREGHVAGFNNVPLSQMKSRWQEIKRDRPVVLMCRSGSRSQQAARILVKHGFSDVRNARGGIMAWKGRTSR